jgi:hypothetical protein
MPWFPETNAWLTSCNAVAEPVERIITPRRGVEETVVTLDGHHGRAKPAIALVAVRRGVRVRPGQRPVRPTGATDRSDRDPDIATSNPRGGNDEPEQRL